MGRPTLCIPKMEKVGVCASTCCKIWRESNVTVPVERPCRRTIYVKPAVGRPP